MPITTDPHYKFDYEEICLAHERRIMRGGQKLWHWFLNLPKETIISGKEALDFMDNYGFSIWDMLFIFEGKSCTIDLVEFCHLYNERKMLKFFRAEENKEKIEKERK